MAQLITNSAVGMAAFVVSCFIVQCAWAGPFKGDKELLKIAATAHRQNQDQLKTWKGTVALTQRSSEDSGEEKVFEALIDFAYDATSGSCRYRFDATRDVVIKDGKENQRMTLTNRAGMFHENTYYNSVYKVEGKGVRMATARERPVAQPGWTGPVFHPKTYFTTNRENLDQELLVLYKNFEDPQLTPGTVSRSGREVVIKQSGEEASFEEKVVSLEKGGNLVRCYSQWDEVENEVTRINREWQWDWKEYNGAWVPTRAAHLREEVGRQTERQQSEFSWKKNVVNEPLDNDEFSLARLGLRQGDVLKDERTNATKRLKGKEFPNP